MKTVMTSRHLCWEQRTPYEHAFNELEEAIGKVIEEGRLWHGRLISISHSITAAPDTSSHFHWVGSFMVVHEARE